MDALAPRPGCRGATADRSEACACTAYAAVVPSAGQCERPTMTEATKTNGQPPVMAFLTGRECANIPLDQVPAQVADERAWPCVIFVTRRAHEFVPVIENHAIQLGIRLGHERVKPYGVSALLREIEFQCGQSPTLSAGVRGHVTARAHKNAPAIIS